MNDKNLRIQIREFIKKEVDLHEFDALLSRKDGDTMVQKKEDWEKEKRELRSNLTNLLKNIEADKYEEGLETIDNVMAQLKDWKNKINNFL